MPRRASPAPISIFADDIAHIQRQFLRIDSNDHRFPIFEPMTDKLAHGLDKGGRNFLLAGTAELILNLEAQVSLDEVLRSGNLAPDRGVIVVKIDTKLFLQDGQIGNHRKSSSVASVKNPVSGKSRVVLPTPVLVDRPKF
ncbi:protein of unknown function [Shinella sp. WSC3-e]|nr:hypothetical protein SHINE37_42672 [Rhizobiaceae bacterium]CAK7257249.1 protein of unknown function [Shinella sp. WSC3-e]